MKHVKFSTGLYSMLLLAIASSAGVLIWSQVISTDTALEQIGGTVTVSPLLVNESQQDEPEVVNISETDEAASTTETQSIEDASESLTEPVTESFEGTVTTPTVQVTPITNQDQVVTPVEVVTILLADSEVSTTVPFTEGMTVHQAMRQADTQGVFTYEVSEFSGLGVFVESINGVGGDKGKNWILRVNGKVASVGASGYILQSGDEITWTYEKNY